MSEIPFYKFRMGRTLYEYTLPEIARQLGRLCAVFERLAEVRVRRNRRRDVNPTRVNRYKATTPRDREIECAVV